MTRFILLILVLMLPLIGLCQNTTAQRIDSLETELKKVGQDTTRVTILCELSRVYARVDSASVFNYGFEALELSKKLGFQKGIVNAKLELAGGYGEHFKLEKAEELYGSVIDMSQSLLKKDSTNGVMRLLMRGYHNLGVNYSYKGDFQKQIEYFEKAIVIAKRLGDQAFLANVFTNLGVVHNNLGSYEKGYLNFIKSGKLQEEHGDLQDIIFDKLTFSQNLYQLDSLPKMKEILDEALAHLKKEPENTDWQMYHREMAMYYAATGKFDKSKQSFAESEAIIDKHNLVGYRELLQQRIAMAYEKAENYDLAKKYMTEYILSNEKNQNGLGLFKGLYKRSGYEAASGKYKAAYQDLLRAFEVYDSVDTKEYVTNLNALELKFATAEKEKQILELENFKKESQLALAEKKSQSYFFAGGLSLLALVLFVGYFIYDKRLKKSRKNELLQQAEVEKLRHEQDSKIYAAMIDGQEKERKRLAIDLHDGLGGRLSGISLNLSKLDKDEPKQYPKKQLQKVMKDLDDSLTELRTIARNMMPETLVKFGLQAALKDYCSSMTGKDTKVTLQFYGNEKGIELSQQVTLYRVIQELINNAIKHANASEVLVQYMREGNQVDITVEDNGIGFKKEIAEIKGSGMGLSNLRTRVAYLKGNLDFHTEENEGTTVNVHLTVDHAA